MSTATVTTLDVLKAQTDVLLALVADLDASEWDRPTRCPPMTVLELVAHLINVAEGTASLASTDAAGQEPNTDRARWWVMADRKPPEEIVSASRSAAEGHTSGTAATALTAGVERMIAALAARAPDDVVGSAARSRILRADELTGSRVLEFGVHTMDVGHATLRGERLDPRAAAVITGILDTLLGEALPRGLGWDTRTYILTGCGRRRLLFNERFTLGPLAARFPIVT